MPHGPMAPDEVPLGSWSEHPAPGTTSSRAAQASKDVEGVHPGTYMGNDFN